MAATLYLVTSCYQGSSSSAPLPAPVFHFASVLSHTNGCEEVSLRGLDLYFQRLVALSIFSCALWPFLHLLWRSLFKSFSIHVDCFVVVGFYDFFLLGVLLTVSLDAQVFNFEEVSFIFSFIIYNFDLTSRKAAPNPMSQRSTPPFFPQLASMILDLTLGLWSLLS